MLVKPLQQTNMRESKCTTPFEGDSDFRPRLGGLLSRRAPRQERKKGKRPSRHGDHKLAEAHARLTMMIFPARTQKFKAEVVSRISGRYIKGS